MEAAARTQATDKLLSASLGLSEHCTELTGAGGIPLMPSSLAAPVCNIYVAAQRPWTNCRPKGKLKRTPAWYENTLPTSNFGILPRSINIWI